MLHEEVLQLFVGWFRQNTFSPHGKRSELLYFDDTNTAITQNQIHFLILIRKDVIETQEPKQ